MRKWIIAAALLFAVPAGAQETETMQQHVDAVAAQGCAVVMSMRGQIIGDQNGLSALVREITTLTEENKALKAAAAPKPPLPSAQTPAAAPVQPPLVAAPPLVGPIIPAGVPPVAEPRPSTP